MTPRPEANQADDTTGGELSAVRSLFGAIEAGIRATAPAALLRALLATMRDQQRAAEAEIIARGQRRRQRIQEFARAARAVSWETAQRSPRRWRETFDAAKHWRESLQKNRYVLGVRFLL